ncbi:hypothetical protein MUP46_02570 [Patescibacteria group bacterium]|nr:hypothetical protein [Patescibacteria group bacterium]
MKKFLKILFLAFSIALLFYLVLPNPPFPKPLPDALQSQEPADTETPLRRAYFTNFTREDVMEYYKNQFSRSSFMGISLPAYRLNYPPEEAGTIIRDQTRSTFLEEIVHPFRESIYINGFEPKLAKDAIFIDNKDWRQKIIIKFVPSPTWVRIAVAVPTLMLIVLLAMELASLRWRKNA